ncbi:M20/M25/M40 family metallo-hydrolase [Paragemmobacter ruber]|uniref:M20/M25/M40 family metallo-hydrolase n=1 Tax=Paragemmobacter ruber TaxID=1985673 RepID=A0ABW9Y2H7_9RHOB|nr:M20/M25/M40 family metallo-hydrolase [Rhodobacter ruber]NBE06612.1 M20/M25/M40 family metallo-hydrolase [Rhodobacter ruber]
MNQVQEKGLKHPPFDAEWDPAPLVGDLARRFVQIPSVTGTSDEAAFAEHLAAILQELPYFRDHPEDVRLIPSHGDPMTMNVVAILRGGGRKAVLVAGHYDTVSIENYHDLRHLSCQPDALKQALLADLCQRSLTEQEVRALADLRTGDFLPGRGMLDMKSGIAAAVAVLDRFSRIEGRHGNLVLCVSPDEERDSRGMRALRDALPKLMVELGLEPIAAINLDVTSDQGDGSEGRAVYTGTIGKLMPFALIVGKSTHASYPYEGVSAQLIASEIMLRIEANAGLADDGLGTTSPSPICLEARDLRDVYEVTTPERTWLAFNWLYHSWTPEELFARFADEVRAGAAAAVERLAQHAENYARKSGSTTGARPAAPQIWTYADLKAEASRQMGAAFPAEMQKKQAELADVDNPLAVSRELTNWLVAVARVSGPAVIIGFASLNYPATQLDLAHPDDAALHKAISDTLATLADDPARRLAWRPYFTGISDMSFFGQPSGNGSSVVAANTPHERLVDRPPPDAIRCPMVNIGPWGREFHQRLERVYMPYAFDDLPRIVADITDRLLANASNRM